MKKHLSIILTITIAVSAASQQDSTKVRSGWTLGVLPSFSFDADQGLQLGLLSNIYYFGDGTSYPEYLHSFYVEASTTSKHFGTYRFNYDSKHLIPNHQLTVDISYLPDALSDFYGFNGYQTVLEATRLDSVSRAYYKMKRNLLRLSADLRGEMGNHWGWLGGLGVLRYDMGSVDVERLNSYTNDDDELLPTDVSLLFDQYHAAGLISDAEATGGTHPYLRGGVSYDTRSRQQNPVSGIYTDAFLTYYAGLGDMKEYNNLKLNAAWRHYVPILGDRIILAYRVGTQLTLAGKSPFYLNTYFNQSQLTRAIYDGLGGANSLRGLLRNRVVGNGFAYANMELRLTLYRFKIGKEFFYIGLNPFLDAGMVVQPYDLSTVDPHTELYTELDLSKSATAPHFGTGCGLKVVMNENFALSVDWATPLNEQDNYKQSNIYIKLGYMF